MVQDVKLILDRHTCRLQIGEGTDNVMVFHVARGIVLGTNNEDPRMVSAGCLYEIVKVQEVLVVPREEHVPLKGTRSQVTRIRDAGQSHIGRDYTVKLWYAASGRNMHTLGSHKNWILDVTFSPNGRRLASASADQTVRVWEVDSGKELHTLRGHRQWVTSVVFSPNGEQLFSTGMDKLVKVWDPNSGANLHTLRGHSGAVNGIVFSADGTRLASAGVDNTVKLWDPFKPQEAHVFSTMPRYLFGATFSPNGRDVALVCSGLTVVLWDHAAQRARIPPCPHPPFLCCSLVISSD